MSDALIILISDNPEVTRQLRPIGRLSQPHPPYTQGNEKAGLIIVDRQFMGRENWNRFCARLEAAPNYVNIPLMIIDRGIGWHYKSRYRKPELPTENIYYINQNAAPLVAAAAQALLAGNPVYLETLAQQLTSQSASI
ncbi:MAG: hypothetical protein FH749_14345 [Firmicutes bacterium]|nr:hypothetical protein [Bacillota bacterium]